jgi:hypothetical protein
MARNEINLTARTRTAGVLRSIGYVLALLVAAGCLASFVAGPEEMAVRLIAGGAGLLIVLAFGWAVAVRRRVPSRLAIDHEGVRVWDGRGRVLVRLAWTELSGVGVMTNEAARRRRLRAAGHAFPWVSRRMASVSIWLELYPADAQAVARHPELSWAWALGGRVAASEERRWLVLLGDGHGQDFPIGEAVQRWRPQLWRGHRSGSWQFGGHDVTRALFAERRGRSAPDSGNA